MSTSTRPTSPSPKSDPYSLAKHSFEIMVRGDLPDFDAVVHPDAVNREANAEPPACRQPGPAGFYATARWLRDMFADLAFEIHEVVTDGDLVVVHNTMSGRHVNRAVMYRPDGSIDQVFPPTGRRFATTQTHWYRLADGKIIEHWANRDDQGTAVQLGWVPPTLPYLLRMQLATRRARRRPVPDAV